LVRIESSERIIAGVSAFGFGGSNAHAVLRELPQAVLLHESSVPALVLCSAASISALQQFVNDQPQTWTPFTNVRQPIATVNLDESTPLKAFSAGSQSAALDKMRAWACSHLPDDMADASPSAYPRGEIVFVFAGQGTHWSGMAINLIEPFPQFKAFLEECATVLSGFPGNENFNLMKELQASPETSLIMKRPAVARQACVAVSTSLCRLLNSLGVKPQAVLGHSFGDIAAGFAAGNFSLKDALQIANLQAAAIDKICFSGRMLAVRQSVTACKALLENFTGLAIACLNGPESCVISGKTEMIESVHSYLKFQTDVKCKILDSDVAFHHPDLVNIADEMTSSMERARIRFSLGNVPVFTGISEHVQDFLFESYFTTNLSLPVDFNSALSSV
jgi:acyl transferase domain-containing protein